MIFQSSLSPAKWLWNKLPSIPDYSKSFSKILHTHKEMWWNRILNEIFQSETEPTKKRRKSDNDTSRKILQMFLHFHCCWSVNVIIKPKFIEH